MTAPGYLSGAYGQNRPAGSDTTDDRGVYRISTLMPGDYLVVAMSTQTTMPASTADAYMQQMLAGGSSLNSDIYKELNSSGAPYPSSGGYRVGDLILQTGNLGRGGGAPLPAPADDGRVFIYPTQYHARPVHAQVSSHSAPREHAVIFNDGR